MESRIARSWLTNGGICARITRKTMIYHELSKEIFDCQDKPSNFELLKNFKLTSIDDLIILCKRNVHILIRFKVSWRYGPKLLFVFEDFI